MASAWNQVCENYLKPSCKIAVMAIYCKTFKRLYTNRSANIVQNALATLWCLKRVKHVGNMRPRWMTWTDIVLKAHNSFSGIVWAINLYHSLGIFSRRQNDVLFLIFPRKQDLTFHANCLLRRQFAWNVKSCFLGKIRKIFQNVVCWKFYPEC